MNYRKTTKKQPISNWGTGCLVSPPDNRDHSLKLVISKSQALPNSRILLITSVKNQFSTNACTGFAVCAAYECAKREQKYENAYDMMEKLKIQTENPSLFYDTSERFVYYGARQKSGITGDNGAYLRDALKTAQKEGLSIETACPFDVNALAQNEKSPSWIAKILAGVVKIKEYIRLDNIVQIKLALSQGMPVVIAVRLREDFYVCKGAYVGKGKLVGVNHAMLCYGYDSQMGIVLFKIKNSWSEKWGNQGFITIPDFVLEKDLIESWSIKL